MLSYYLSVTETVMPLVSSNFLSNCFILQIHASVVRGKDGSAGFSLLMFSEDYSLALLDKPAAVSTGLFTAE